MSLHYVVLLLGSNLGDTDFNLKNAMAKIENRIGKINFFSEILESTAVEFVSKNIFRNIALDLFTKYSPFSILKIVKEIEKEMGRLSDSSVTGGYTDRVIDIDIVTFNNINFISRKLEIPHKKHLYEREFSVRLLEGLKENFKTQI